MAAPYQSVDIWAVVDSRENHLNCCYHVSDFKAKMHQNRFRLGLHPRPRWGSSQHSPRSSNWNKGDLLLTEGRGAGKEEGIGKKVKGREGRGEREKRMGGVGR